MIDIETVADLVPDKLYLFCHLKLTRENLDKNDLHENVRSLKLESIIRVVVQRCSIKRCS